MAEKQVNLTRN